MFVEQHFNMNTFLMLPCCVQVLTLFEMVRFEVSIHLRIILQESSQQKIF